MRYISTRGKVRNISFRDAVIMGLADDGGLLLPESIPALTPGDIEALGKLAYPELAFQIISLFAGDLPSSDLKEIIERSYRTFTHPEITPVVHKDGVYILELFHGPTLAFKDLALQFLGNLFEYLLNKRGEKMNILGATSGDTGSAAIYGVRGKQNIHIFILHPHQKVSHIQELQMTTVTDPNVFNLAIRGTFDDGQRIVKEIFGDTVSPEALTVVTLAVDRGHADLLGDIARIFGEIAEKERGIVVAEVTTAIALTDAMRASITEKLAASLGRPVTLREHVDGSILGGIIINVAGRVLDGSLASQLKAMRATLATTPQGGEA